MAPARTTPVCNQSISCAKSFEIRLPSFQNATAGPEQAREFVSTVGISNTTDNPLAPSLLTGLKCHTKHYHPEGFGGARAKRLCSSGRPSGHGTLHDRRVSYPTHRDVEPALKWDNRCKSQPTVHLLHGLDSKVQAGCSWSSSSWLSMPACSPMLTRFGLSRCHSVTSKG